MQRHRTADEAGVAALRHDRDAGRVAERAAPPATSSTVPGRTTAARRAAEPAGPVDDVRGDDVGIGARRGPHRPSSRNAASRSGRHAHRRSMLRPQRVPKYRAVRRSDRAASLRGRLLVAAPPLVDPNFDRTVVLMLEHGEDGGLGIVLNRRSETALDDVFPEWRPARRRRPTSCSPAVRSSTDAVIALARRRARRRSRASCRSSTISAPSTSPTTRFDLGASLESLRVFVGYAGWSPGQLEAELDAGRVVRRRRWTATIRSSTAPERSVARRAAPPARPHSRCSRTTPRTRPPTRTRRCEFRLTPSPPGVVRAVEIERRGVRRLARCRRPPAQRAAVVPAPRPRSRRGLRRRRRARVPGTRLGVRRRRQRVQAQRVRPGRSQGHGRRRSSIVESGRRRSSSNGADADARSVPSRVP